MKIYKIAVKEILSRAFEIEAGSSDDAISKVMDLYKNEEIVLDSADYVETEFLKLEDTE